MHSVLLVAYLAAVPSSVSAVVAPSRLLVVGGSGFLGREVCRSAVRRGWSVTSISRRGANPDPSCAKLARVQWVSGDASDEALLAKHAADSDAFVHAAGFLFDADSGLAQLNPLVSGAGAKSEQPGSTYEVAARSAVQLLGAAERAGGGPVCFVSAAGTDGAFRKAEVVLPEFARRYFAAKRTAEEAFSRAGDGVRPIVVRPAPMWSSNKWDVLPLLPAWNALAAVLPALVERMMRVDVVGDAITGALADGRTRGVVGSAAELCERAPLASLRKVQPVDTLTSGLASIARLPFGTDASALRGASPAAREPPASDLVLYEFEGCPFCRRVREVVTHLDLAVTVVPCARGSRHREQVVALSGKPKPTYPFLVDKAAGVSLFESEDICNHLIATYGGRDETLPPPASYFLTSTAVSGWMPTLLRGGRGGAIEPRLAGSAPPDQPLTLYSYEGNQFCRLVREVLCELDLPYVLRSTGKGSPRRSELQELSGATTAPYLADPNTGTQMGESADIVEYLYTQYGAPSQA